MLICSFIMPNAKGIIKELDVLVREFITVTNMYIFPIHEQYITACFTSFYLLLFLRVSFVSFSNSIFNPFSLAVLSTQRFRESIARDTSSNF